MVGEIPLGTAQAEQTFGAAGIYGPADVDFPADGIIAQGKLNQQEIIFGDLSLEKIDYVRKHGQVLNFNDASHLKDLADNIRILDI